MSSGTCILNPAELPSSWPVECCFVHDSKEAGKAILTGYLMHQRSFIWSLQDQLFSSDTHELV